MAKTPSKNNKTAILDAAETLMAEHGIKGVSLRSILAEAKANSAALHYHFGSREGVIEAILARNGTAMSLRRLEMLTCLEEQEDTIDAFDIVDVVVDPMVQMLHEEGEAGRRFIRFLARLQSDRVDIHRKLEQEHFPDIWNKTGRLLTIVCPAVPEQELNRRVMIMVDTMLHSLASAEVMAEVWVDDHYTDPLVEHVETLKNFLAAGLSSPYRRSRVSSAKDSTARTS